MRNFAAALLTATILTACAVGADYTAPQTHTAGDFARRDAALYTSAEPAAAFWTVFGDPQLSRLVEEALTANTDLKVAVARLDQARAISRQSRLDLLPTLRAGGSASAARTATAQTFPGANRNTETYQAGVDATWEIDLFGRVRRGAEASRADAEAAAADFRAVQVSTAAEVARTYLELQGRQEQLRVARRNADNQQDTLKLTETRIDAGRGTAFDTVRAQAQLELTLSRIPALEVSVAAAQHRLAVLTGRQPGALTLEATTNPIALPRDVAVGTPADLLRRRPDIQAAERRLNAATARVGVAQADLFPRLVLNGSLATVAPTLGSLFAAGTGASAATGFVDWAFLDLGRVRAQIDAADAAARESLASYEGTVLKALEDSENALVAYDRTRAEAAHLAEAATAGREGARLARARFENGVADFLQVLDAERSLLEAEDRLAETRTRAGTSLVAVYTAVAGGWPSQVQEAAAP